MLSIRRGAAQPQSEDTMNKSFIPRAAAVLAATATTVVLFSAVAGLADDDRALLLAARTKPTVIADTASGSIKR
jgi:hypothetical protein